MEISLPQNTFDRLASMDVDKKTELSELGILELAKTWLQLSTHVVDNSTIASALMMMYEDTIRTQAAAIYRRKAMTSLHKGSSLNTKILSKRMRKILPKY